jgi:hypothetical protein
MNPAESLFVIRKERKYYFRFIVGSRGLGFIKTRRSSRNNHWILADSPFLFPLTPFIIFGNVP